MAIDVVLNSKVALDRLKNYLNQAEVDVNEDDVSDGMIALDVATFTWPVAETANTPTAEPGDVFRMRRITLSLPQGRMTLVCGPLGAGKTLFVSEASTAQCNSEDLAQLTIAPRPPGRSQTREWPHYLPTLRDQRYPARKPQLSRTMDLGAVAQGHGRIRIANELHPSRQRA